MFNIEITYYCCEYAIRGITTKRSTPAKKDRGKSVGCVTKNITYKTLQVNKFFCHECNRYCINNECLRKHKNVCDKEYKCDGCNFVLQRNDRTHIGVCGYGQCHNCKQENIRIIDHKCYMQRRSGKGGYCVKSCVCNEKSTEKQKNCTFSTNYVFFDYEAQQNTGTHIPNMVISHDFEGQKYVFSTDDTDSANDKFCKWALSKVMKGTTYIAHNSKAYDTYFIIQYILKNMPIVKYKVIRNGTKIMVLEIKYGGLNIKFIDCHNFIQLKLSEFPKTCGLKEAKKCTFHIFLIHRKIKDM